MRIREWINKLILRYLRLEAGQVWELRDYKPFVVWKNKMPIYIIWFDNHKICFRSTSSTVPYWSNMNLNLIRFVLKYRRLKSEKDNTFLN